MCAGEAVHDVERRDRRASVEGRREEDHIEGSRWVRGRSHRLVYLFFLELSLMQSVAAASSFNQLCKTVSKEKLPLVSSRTSSTDSLQNIHDLCREYPMYLDVHDASEAYHDCKVEYRSFDASFSTEDCAKPTIIHEEQRLRRSPPSLRKRPPKLSRFVEIQ
mmetsp:Transcript_73198/g.195174  ORF Transcript_73198/g.195174 Transcript_73198/m.195174 type:complete len:162 (-) Transcript_73198:13-498(-)